MSDLGASVPTVRLEHLDQLWFQVTGTLCNLACHHCFIHCSPHNRTFGFLTIEQVRHYLDEARELGVKEYYYTGGEPFLHPQMTDILCLTLQYGPATVLTNGTVFRPEWLQRLVSAERESLYGLEFRVSIDGVSAEMNDPIRGIGTFDRAIDGLLRLVDFGFLPIITVARTWPSENDAVVFGQFVTMLRERGYARPRIKILPTLHLGAEETRSRPYADDERVTLEMLDGYDTTQLLCSHARTVTDRGVHICPLLIDLPNSRLGASLTTAAQSFAITTGPCFTCYQYGAICSNATSRARTEV